MSVTKNQLSRRQMIGRLGMSLAASREQNLISQKVECNLTVL
jgi:hypothetical protein